MSRKKNVMKIIPLIKQKTENKKRANELLKKAR